MSTSETELKKIAALACLHIESNQLETLTNDISAMMSFVEQLCQVNTKGIDPLWHPLNLHQRLREDLVTEENSTTQLAELTQAFTDHLYWVPKVIATGN